MASVTEMGDGDSVTDGDDTLEVDPGPESSHQSCVSFADPHFIRLEFVVLDSVLGPVLVLTQASVDSWSRVDEVMGSTALDSGTDVVDVWAGSPGRDVGWRFRLNRALQGR